jgi:hypothetical protein
MMSEDGIDESSMDGSSDGCSKGECDGISTTTIPCVGICDLSLKGSSDERGKEPREGIDSGVVVMFDGAVDGAIGLGESTMDISIFDFSEGRSEG